MRIKTKASRACVITFVAPHSIMGRVNQTVVLKQTLGGAGSKTIAKSVTKTGAKPGRKPAAKVVVEAAKIAPVTTVAKSGRGPKAQPVAKPTVVAVVNVPTIKLKRRSAPGRSALRAVRLAQRTATHQLRYIPFIRDTRYVAGCVAQANKSDSVPLRWSNNALVALHAVYEHALVRPLQIAQQISRNCKRPTVNANDVQLAIDITRNATPF